MILKNVISWAFIILFTFTPLAGCTVNNSTYYVDTNDTEYYDWNITDDEIQISQTFDVSANDTGNYSWNVTNAEIQMDQTFDYAASSVSLKTPVVYVDTDGTGNYNCDGTNDHVQINQALAYINGRGGGTVYLRGPNTYWIDSTLNIGADTVLTGDSTAEIKLVANAGWASDVPLIRGATGADNIVITGFIIDGNSESQSGIPKGQGYYNLILFQSSNNVEVSHMRMEWGTGDGMKIYNGNGIKFLYNDVYKLGHDACYMLYSNNGECAYNTVMTRTNSACRITWGSHFTVHDNIFYSDLSGGDSTGPAIEIDKTNTGSTAVFDDIEIYNNKIYSINGAGIWMFAGYPDNVIRAKNVHIHHNTFTKVGQYATNTGYSNAAIVIQNFDNTIIENNVFDDGGHAAIKWYVWAGHIAQQNTQFTTYVRNNIIMNSDGVSGITGSGVGIWNTQPSYAKFIVQNNNIYNNKNGQTYGSGFTMSNNLNVDPLCADSTNSKLSSRDYHLKSKAGRYSSGKWVTDSVSSSLIDAGNSKCICSNEPSPNGALINIGKYGNTNEASKSGSSASTVPNQIDDSLTAYDNRLREASPTTVTSDSNFIDIGQSGTRYRDVMWFDLSEYSTTDTVSKATLSLYWYYPTGATRTSDTVVEVYRPLEWDQKYVTWNNRASGTPWTTAGGNWYDKNGVSQGSTPYASLTFPAKTVPGNKYYEFDVTQLVQEYVTGKNKNTGFFLKAKTESGNYIAFYSSEWSNAAQRPKLTVTTGTSSTPIDNVPVANAGADKTATTGSTVSFDGGSSTDDKGIVSYRWDFDTSNGITIEATGKTATKTYTTAGTYTVTLTVIDVSGQQSSDTLKVVVSSPVDKPPVANAGADKTTTRGTAVSFTGSLSTDDKGIVSYRWDFDASNGITNEATGMKATKTYTTAGTYTVTLTVIDASGQKSTDTLKVVVK
ncbi:disaggregatase related repeat-containing protein [Methanomethylovorans sp.]|uniref:disaggregatase related repeat-containing protein n=1 Tax=Methanomethylovorans sp. TaxID=2758717 RepID=UPI00351C67A8